MQMNDAGYALLKRFEGCVLTAYRDQGGTWTIGWGHTGRDVHEGLVWDQIMADTILVHDVQRTVDELLDMIEPDLNDNQFSACVDLAYNIGSHAFEGSSALYLINSKYPSPLITDAIMKWIKVRIDGVLHISRGLRRRRQAEVDLWNTAVGG